MAVYINHENENGEFAEQISVLRSQVIVRSHLLLSWKKFALCSSLRQAVLFSYLK